MAKNLKQETAKALFWNAIDKFGGQFINLVIGVVLARYFLSTQEYGVVGMLSLFVAVSNVFVDGGFSAALIRKEQATDRDYNTVFYVNLLVAVFFYLVFWFAAPFIANYFEQPILIPLSRVLFLIFIINAFGLIQSTQLIKQIKFRIYTRINLIALLLSGLTAVVLAYFNYGVWALVWQIVLLNLIKALLYWIVNMWRPRFIFDKSSFVDLFSFSFKLLLANLVNTISLNIYSLFIGKYYQASMLGNYTQAGKWNDMAVTSLASTLQTATYPIFSSIQSDEERMMRALRKTMRLTAFVTFPSMLLLMLISRPLILGVLTDKWIEAIPFLQVLSLSGIFTILTAVNNNILKVSGRSDLLLFMEVAKIMIVLGILLYTMQISILFVVIGLLVSRVLIYLLNMFVIGYVVKYSIKHQLFDLIPYATLTFVSVAAAFPFKFIIENNILLIVIQLTVSILLYFILNRKLNSVILNDLITMLKVRTKRN